MRKLILGAIGMAMAASIVPASADPALGCQVVGGDTPAGTSCTYAGSGADTSIVILTPNSVTVTVDSGEGPVEFYSNGSADPEAQGVKSLDLPAGTVKVTVGPDSAEVVEGWIGLVAINETA